MRISDTAEFESSEAEISDFLSSTPEADSQVALSRLRKPVRVGVFLGVVVVLIAGSFIAGRFVQAPSTAAVQAAQETVSVAVRVEKRVVAEQFEVAAAVTVGPTVTLTPQLSLGTPGGSPIEAPAGEDRDLTGQTAEATQEDTSPDNQGLDASKAPPLVPSSERAVVTGISMKPGQTISYGQLLGEVSGRPVFAAPSSLPLYRDLILGSEGEDVRGLQELLTNLGYAGAQPTGTLDAWSIEALNRFYLDNGYDVPRSAAKAKVFSWREFLPVPNDKSNVISVSPVGTVLEGKATFMAVKTSPDVITAKVTVGDADTLKAGQTLFVAKGTSAPVETKVLAISAFTVDEATKWSGHIVSAALPADLKAANAEPLKLSSSSQPEPGIALPAIAVRQDSTGPYVVLHEERSDIAENKTGAEAERRVAIKVLAQNGGWVSIEPVNELPVGTMIQVAE